MPLKVAESVPTIVTPRHAVTLAPRRDPGLIIHHDPRNENYLITDILKSRAVKRGAVELTPTSRRHRQYRYYDQGPTSGCTGYGCVTLLATQTPFNAPPVTGAQWYAENQKFDRAQGRHWPGDQGATVVAAMEVGRLVYGFFTEYRWGYTIRTLQEAILRGAIIAGTYWYDSMFDRDAEGIVLTPAITAEPVGGHLFTIRGYNARRDLWVCPNTWGDGDYLIPGDLMHRLLREEGEFALPSEVKIPRHWTPVA